MLYVIGLGLSDEKDITVKGLEVCYPVSDVFPLDQQSQCLAHGAVVVEDNVVSTDPQAVKKCARVYLEAYTSILMVEKEKLVSGE